MTLLTLLQSPPAPVSYGLGGTVLNQTTASSTWAVPYPATVANDLMVLHVVSVGGTATDPVGWTQIYRETVVTNPRGGLWIKKATGSETGTLSVSIGSTTGAAQIHTYKNVHPVTPLDAASVNISNNAAGTGTVVIPEITTVTQGALLVYGTGANSTTITHTGPGTERTDFASTGVGKAGAFYDDLPATVGATGTRTITQSLARAHWTAMFALRPSNGVTGGGVGTGTLTRRIVGIPANSTTEGLVQVVVTGTISARLKCSTDSAGTANVVYGTPVTPDSDGNARLTVTGLIPDTNYYYRVEMTDAAAGVILDTDPIDGRLRTAPLGQTNFAFNFGSCESSADSLVYDAINARNDAFFLHLGDFFYSDGSGTTTTNLRSKLNTKLNLTRHKALFADTPMLYTPGDHDVADNGTTNGSDPTAWANWRTVRDELFPDPALYYTFTWGRVRFIKLDLRNFKSDPAITDDSAKTALGSTQKQWLKDQITAATEPAVVIIQSDPWVGSAITGDDTWFGFTTERTELGNYFAASGKQIVMIGGDMHAVAAEDGTNAAGGITTFQAAAISQTASQKGGPWTVGPFPASGAASVQQYGRVAVTDTGSSIDLAFTGYDSSNTQLVTLTKTITVNAAPPPVVVTSSVTSANSGSVNVTTLDVNTPAGLTDSDLLITAVMFQNNLGSSSLNVPAGWTRIGPTSTALRPSGLYARPVTTAAGTPSSWTWSTTAAAGRAFLICFRVTGADLDNYLDASGTESSATGTSSIVLPSVSVNDTNRLLLGYFYTNGTGTTVSAVSPVDGLSQVAITSVNPASNGLLWVGQENPINAGPTGSRAATLSPAAASSGGYMVAITPAAGSGNYFTGSANFTGAGTLTSTRTTGFSQSADLTGSGTLTATGISNITRTAAFTGAGTLTSTRTIAIDDSEAFTSSGTLSTTRVVNFTRASGFTGTGTLIATGSININDTEAFTSSGTLSSTRTVNFSRATALSGSGTLTANTSLSIDDTEQFSGTGTLSTARIVNFSRSTSLSGSGTLTAIGIVNFTGSATFTGTGFLTTATNFDIKQSTGLTGSGTLTQSGNTPGTTRTASLTGSGTLTAAGKPNFAGVINASGTGTLTSSQIFNLNQNAILTGSGTLSATASAISQSISAEFTGSGTLGTQTAGAGTGSLSASVTGTLTAIGSTSFSTTASLNGTGILSSSRTLAIARASAFTDSGTLSSTRLLTVSGSSPLTGSGTLTAIGSASPTKTVNFTGSGLLSGVGNSVQTAEPDFVSTGTLTAIASNTTASTSVGFSATGSLNISAGNNGTASANFNSTGILSAQIVSITVTNQALFTGGGFLTSDESISFNKNSNQVATGTLTAQTSVQFNKAVGFGGSGTLSGTLTSVSTSRTALFGSTGTLNISVAGDSTATANFLSSGILTVQTSFDISKIVSFSTSGNLFGQQELITVNRPVQLSTVGTLTAVKIGQETANGTANFTAIGQLTVIVSVNNGTPIFTGDIIFSKMEPTSYSGIMTSRTYYGVILPRSYSSIQHPPESFI